MGAMRKDALRIPSKVLPRVIDAGAWVHHAPGHGEPRLASTGTCQAYATEHAARGKAFDLNIGVSLFGAAIVSHGVSFENGVEVLD